MNGESILIDANIALYLLTGDNVLANILHGKNVYVSFITELELLGYNDITREEHLLIERFLKDCIIIDLNETIKNDNNIETKKQNQIFQMQL